MERKMQTRQEYDNWLLQSTTGYCVTRWLGRGKYKRKLFSSFQDAIDFKNRMQKRNKNVGAIVYAITAPKESLYPVEVPIA